MSINRTIFGIETQFIGKIIFWKDSINRTIFGIETLVIACNNSAKLPLSIAPSLELKLNAIVSELGGTATINRTIFGIETLLLVSIKNTQSPPINRTIFGIETMQIVDIGICMKQLSIAPSLELKQHSVADFTTMCYYQSHHLWN